MRTFAIPLLFLFGLFAGSWLTRIAYRLPRGISLFRRPNFCPECEQRLGFFDCLPLLGRFRRKGRCAHCGQRISAQYPAVEFATGILWALEGWRLAGLQSTDAFTIAGVAAAELSFLAAMVVMVLVDWEFLIIPDEISLGGMAAGLLFSLFFPALHDGYVRGDPPDHWGSALYSFTGMAGGIVSMLVLYYAGKILFAPKIREAQKEDPEIDSVLGLGDVKLMGCFGAFLGLPALLPLFLIAVFSGSAAGIYLKISSGDPGGASGLAALRKRWESGDSFFPFGPFLAFGAVIMLYLR